MENKMIVERSAAILVLLAGILALSWAAPEVAEKNDFFPKCASPEEEGIDSAILVEMFNEIVRLNADLHSIIVIRNDRCVLESYVAPYGPGDVQNIKSICKSLMSALTGIALRDEVLENLDRTVESYFPEFFSDEMDPRKKTITLRHLLTMMSGMQIDEMGPAMNSIVGSENWVKTTFECPLATDPGTTFKYSSVLAHAMSAILTKSSGKNLFDYAKAVLFQPLGIDTESLLWTHDPQGYPFGGGELWLTPRDLARFGWLYLKKGKWDGKQLVPAEWIEESTRNHLKGDTPVQYGYSWWLVTGGTYAAKGWGGQLVAVIPDLNMVVVVTGADHGLPSRLLPPFVMRAAASNDPLPANPEACQALEEAVTKLAASDPQPVAKLPEIARKISGKPWALKQPNTMNYKSIALEFDEESKAECILVVETTKGPVRLKIGLDNVFRFTFTGGFGSKPKDNMWAMRGRWRDETSFSLDAHEMGSPIHVMLDLRFKDNGLEIVGSARPQNQLFSLKVKESKE